jgi:hypothetical protein
MPLYCHLFLCDYVLTQYPKSLTVSPSAILFSFQRPDKTNPFLILRINLGIFTSLRDFDVIFSLGSCQQVEKMSVVKCQWDSEKIDSFLN